MNTWAVVELMGHQRALGYLEEVTVAGAGFLQITTPGPTPTDEPKAVRIVSPSAVYAINPATEERIRAHLYPTGAAELGPGAYGRYAGEPDEPDDYCGSCGYLVDRCVCDNEADADG